MGLPGYYRTTDSPPNIIEFPMAERPGSSPMGRRAGPIGREHTDIRHETEEGVLWIYPQVRRRVWDLTFRLTTEDELNFFETLHLAVDGEAQPFYFIPDVDESPMQEYLVRKEPSWLPSGIEFARVIGGNNIAAFDYHLILREESEAAYILA